MNNPKPDVLFHRRPCRAPDVTKMKFEPSSKAANHRQSREPQKLLVRNSEMTVSKTLYKTDAQSESSSKGDPCAGRSSQPQKLYETDLSEPNLNSALRIVGEINRVKLMSSNPEKIQLVDEGKVLQKVNFPYEEHLYHDLVALNVSHSNSSGQGSSARPSSRYLFHSRESDKKPKLSQFFCPSFSTEFCTSQEAPLHVFERLNSDFSSVYQRMCLWDVKE